MRYFICSLDQKSVNLPHTCLAIPAEYTERIIPAIKPGQTGLAEASSEAEAPGDEILFSLPGFLKLKDPQAPHGLVLKRGSQKKIVLLSPKIEVELEIPEEDIQALPNTLDEILLYFRGAFFSEERLILILNPQKLIESL